MTTAMTSPRGTGLIAACSLVLLGAPSPSMIPQDPVTVPVRLQRNQILVQAYLGENGPYYFALDTAISPSAIDLSVADELGIEVRRDRPIAAAGIGNDPVQVYPSSIIDLEIGEQRFGSVDAVAMDLAPLAARLGSPLHGILGHSFLASRSVRIDYPGRRLTIWDGAAQPPEAEAAVSMPLELRGTGVMLDPVFLNERPLRLVLDTGGSMAMTVDPGAIERLSLDSLRGAAEPGQVRGARGLAEILVARADSIRIGSLEVPGLEIALTDWSQAADGTLGNAFLRHFVLTLDYVKRRLYIETGATAE
ncbi:MAG: hypothetical protein GKS06_11080 [Acidobacteria bacterium]|nr:hypothetical protein [Acidobacteriota bacterium]